MDFAASVARARSLPRTLPPVLVDIDGTLTDDQRALDPRVVPVLRAWPDMVVVATGKALPYPVALCEFLGIEIAVIAENGGVVLAGRETLHVAGDSDAATAVAEAYRDAGHSLGWGGVDLVNRWRETELAVSRESPLDPLETLAADHGLEVVDTGYAYHVKSPGMTKGTGLVALCEEVSHEPDDFVAIGDSENDAAAFDRVDTSVAVGNADAVAREAADHVTDASFGEGFLEAVAYLCEQTS